jgi:hypothetical protein
LTEEQLVASSEDLAADLGVDEGDVRVLLRQLGEQTRDMPDELAEWIRRTFDPHGERAAPGGLYWPRRGRCHSPRPSSGTNSMGPSSTWVLG